MVYLSFLDKDIKNSSTKCTNIEITLSYFNCNQFRFSHYKISVCIKNSSKIYLFVRIGQQIYKIINK